METDVAALDCDPNELYEMSPTELADIWSIHTGFWAWMSCECPDLQGFS